MKTILKDLFTNTKLGVVGEEKISLIRTETNYILEI